VKGDDKERSRRQPDLAVAHLAGEVALPRINLGIVAIFLAAGLLFSANTVRGFLLPLYATSVGIDKAQVGLLFSAFAIAAAALALPAGIVIDKLGAPLVLCFSVVVTTASHATLGLTTRYELLLAEQFLGGLGSSASMAALMAALADAVPQRRVGRSMGWLTFSNQAGYLAGPVLAATALSWLPLYLTLTGTAVLSLVALPLSMLVARPDSQSQGHGHDTLRHLTFLIRRPGFTSFAITLFSAAMLWGTLEAYLPLLGTEHMGFTNAQVGIIISIQALINGASRIPAGWLVDFTKSPGAVATICSLAYALAIAAAPHLGGIHAALAVIISVALIASAFVALSTSFAELAGIESRGIAMGAYVAVVFLGLGIGPVLFGPTMEAHGFKAGFVLCGVTASLLTIGAFVSRFVHRITSDGSHRGRRR
jgi:MFS transporter, DHA1 family, multidrug resistance protein